MKKPPAMEVRFPTSSHWPALAEAASQVGGGLVIEHGAGLYSTPLLARLGCRVVCVESHEGWHAWAAWVYDEPHGYCKVVESVDYAKLAEAALVFIDGPAEERGPLLSACIEAGVPTIIAHDTDPKTRDYYGYKPHHFMVTRYDVTYPVARTTVWKLKPPMGVPFDV
jgi:hypothetical protein